MKKLISSLVLFLLVITSNAQNVGIGTNTPHPSAKLEVSSNNSGFLPPRMTSTERDAIASPAVGLQIYNLTTHCLEIFDFGKWNSVYCVPIDSTTIVDSTLLTDIDGHTYPTVQICNQTWMAKNLDVTRYRNGDIIPQVTDPTEWANLTTGAWCWYNNDSATYGSVYGRLYNWYAVNDPRGLAPIGWHVPSDGEWNTLTDCLGGANVAGGKLKNISGWSNGGNGTNSIGFNGLPGGGRYETSEFVDIGTGANFWSSNDNTSNSASYYYLNYSNSSLINYNYSKGRALSVRCVKDTPITTLNNGLVAYYPFNGNANDESGNGNNGVVNGATLTTDRFGNSGKAYSFDGVNDYITSNTSFLDVSLSHSISIWWKSTDSTKINQTLFNTGPHTLENCAFHYITTNPNPPYNLVFGLGNGQGGWIVGGEINTTPPTSQQWHHFVWRKENPFVWSFYFDGLQIYSFTSSSNVGSILANIRFGAENNGFPGGGANFNGYLDDIRIYNRALTQAEISYLATH